MTRRWPRRPIGAPRPLSHFQDRTPTLKWLVLLGLHAALAIGMYHSRQLATVHALAVFVVGLWFVTQDRQPLRLIYLCGYIVGAEVLWRMTRADVFWEFGKYAIASLLLLAILRWRMRIRALPVIYFALLVPSAFITAGGLNVMAVREPLSFNLSGPFTLAVAAIFFANVKIDWSELRCLLFSVLLPIVGIATITFFAVQTAEFIYFTNESNFVASAGFGPNQVSAVLGLGSLLSWIYFVLEKDRDRFRYVLFGISVWLLVHAVLTFSRGGFFNFIVSTLLALPYFMRLRQKQLRRGALSVLVLACLLYAFSPMLDQFTQGMFKQRYMNPDTAHRVSIINSDIKIGLSNPLLGVGPGEAKKVRLHHLAMIAAAHTEFSRLFAEHGAFGIGALLLLFVMFLRNLTNSHNPLTRGLFLALTIWSLAEMSHAAMRIAAISFMYAIPFAQVELAAGRPMR